MRGINSRSNFSSRAATSPMRFSDILQVFRSERRGTEKVIKKAGIGRRAMPQLGFREEFKHGGGQQMGRGVAINIQRFRFAFGQQAQVNIFFQRLAKVGKLPAVFGGCGSMLPGLWTLQVASG